jgi:DNA ligase (NAD+)
MDDPARLRFLRNQVLKAKQAYYFGAQPIMTDAEYDALEDELRKLDPDDAVLNSVGAPVAPDSILTKAKHRIPMGSQAKVNTHDEFAEWYEKRGGGAVHASLKGDGASAAAYYVRGRLDQVISRGDGSVGEDITANAVKFKGLPALVEQEDGAPFTGAVRLEVILTLDDWGKVDPNRSKNPRNLGNGIMGRKNGKDSHLLSAFAFDVQDDDWNFETETGKSEHLQQLGFQLMPYAHCENLEACIAYYDEVVRTRAQLPFWIDGAVMKLDDLALQASHGVTSGRPKGQTAWKFASEGAETVLKSYVISGGHTGVLVPTAQFEPVEIGGTTVQNALLNNWEEIERLDVAVGDTVYVIKANDIIPKIIEVRSRPADRESIPEPTTCPFCGGEVGRKTNTSGEEGVATVCLNPECPKKTVGKIKRWIKSLDIQGIGDSVREAMVEQLGLEDPSGLYTLRDDEDLLANLIINEDKGIRLGKKRALTILEEVEKTRTLELRDFVGSLGVEGLGKRRVELMMQAVPGQLDGLEDWRSGKLRDLEFAAEAGVPTLGESLQRRIDASAEVIDALLAKGVVVKRGASEQAAADAAAKAETSKGTVAITGKLPSGKKKNDFKEPLEKAGYELVDKVSKELTYLVLADPNSTSSKAVKARKYGVKLISEDELEKLVQ